MSQGDMYVCINRGDIPKKQVRKAILLKADLCPLQFGPAASRYNMVCVCVCVCEEERERERKRKRERELHRGEEDLESLSFLFLIYYTKQKIFEFPTCSEEPF